MLVGARTAADSRFIPSTKRPLSSSSKPKPIVGRGWHTPRLGEEEEGANVEKERALLPDGR